VAPENVTADVTAVFVNN